ERPRHDVPGGLRARLLPGAARAGARGVPGAAIRRRAAPRGDASARLARASRALGSPTRAPARGDAAAAAPRRSTGPDPAGAADRRPRGAVVARSGCGADRAAGGDRACVAAAAGRGGEMSAAAVATAVLVRLGEVSNRTFVLPLLIFYPTSRCNSRCISCDWWKRSGADDLSLDEMRELAGGMPSLRTRVVVVFGGGPLPRPRGVRAAGGLPATRAPPPP